MPPWALAVAETRPRGLTGRVGAGQCPGLPRDEARFSSRRLGRNPPSGAQSLSKTPVSSRLVAPCNQFKDHDQATEPAEPPGHPEFQVSRPVTATGLRRGRPNRVAPLTRWVKN